MVARACIVALVGDAARELLDHLRMMYLMQYIMLTLMYSAVVLCSLPP
jgi:hypothetical protein